MISSDKGRVIWALFKPCLFFALVVLVTFDVRGQITKPCSEPILKKPAAYKNGSELNYLAWIEYGKPGQKALASLLLLELDEKTEYDSTQELSKCAKKDIPRYALLLALFDMRPSEYRQQLEKLVDKRGRTNAFQELEGIDGDIPSKCGLIIKRDGSEVVFDWQLNAAVRLIKAGYASEKTLEIILWLADSPYFNSYRVAAKEVFDLFDGIPPFETGPKIDDYNPTYRRFVTVAPEELQKYWNLQYRQLDKISGWFRKNRKKLVWDDDAHKYFVRDAKGGR